VNCPLHRSFCRYPDELRNVFEGLKTTVAYRTGETVFDEGARAHSVFALCEGRVKLTTASRNGRSLLLRFVQAGEMLALPEIVVGPGSYGCSAIAVEPSLLAVIPRDTFMKFVRSYPETCVAVTVALSEQYELALREAKFYGMGDTSTERLAHLLLEWAGECGTLAADGVHIPLHVTHGDLAQAIGATRETVTRVLGTLTRDDVIERRSDEIVIHHADELSRLSSDDDITRVCDADASASGEGDLSMSQGPRGPGGS
jgi:CRP/FNR family transcriptional regulator